MEKRGIRIFCVTVFAMALMTLAGKEMPEEEVPSDIASSDMQSTAEETETEEGMLEEDSSQIREEEYADAKEEEPIENMVECTLMANEDGTILYCEDPGYLLQEDAEVTEPESILERYQGFNKNLFGGEFLNPKKESTVKTEVRFKYDNKEIEEFRPSLCENGSFPEELILKLEEIWYHDDGDWGILNAVISDRPGEIKRSCWKLAGIQGRNMRSIMIQKVAGCQRLSLIPCQIDMGKLFT